MLCCFNVFSFPLTIGCVVLALCCGFIYGLAIGSITACIGLLVGGFVAYYGCKKLLSEPVLRLARKRPTLRIILKSLKVCHT